MIFVLIKDLESFVFVQVLWFGPSRSSLNDHNWYGNVSFQISMNQLCYKFGTNFFYIDKQELSTHTATRLVLASSETLNGFNRVDLHEVGSPLQFDWGSWKYVSQCESAYGLLPHELEIGIQADEEECKWLYQNCSVEGNDHSDVNKFDICRFEPHKCHRYNTFSKTCPFPLNKTAADEKLKTYRSETVKLFSNLL